MPVDAQRIRLKRAYDEPAPDDGTRVLVDRLWPRGLSKDRARVDHWLRDIAPSAELRTWYHHDPAKYEGFQRRYRQELEHDPGRSALAQLRALVRDAPVTLLFAARDEAHSNAAVLRDVLTTQS